MPPAFVPSPPRRDRPDRRLWFPVAVAILAVRLVTACAPEATDPVPSQTQVSLEIRGYAWHDVFGGQTASGAERFVEVRLVLDNPTRRAVPAGHPQFSLVVQEATFETHEASARSATPCPPELVADPGGRRACRVVFLIPAGRAPTALRYVGDDVQATASFAGLEPELPPCQQDAGENTLLACSDQCSNDDDPFVDCEDADCCGVRSDCPAGTYCGGPLIECISGPEAGGPACSDGCDNDGSGSADCSESTCCGAIACPSTTPCGATGDPYRGILVVEDAVTEALDPNALPAAAAPCRAPAKVEVRSISDGDTIEVGGLALRGRIRLIGVDAPELGAGGANAECYAENARDFLEPLRGRAIWLTFDAECTDRFGRSLAYAWFGSGASDLVQRQLLRRGLARPLPIFPNVTFENAFADAAARAQASGNGLWGECGS